ncbi:unnamed protein product [Arctogadus glacialis]
MSVWIRVCQRCAKILAEANMNNHSEPEMEGLKVLLLSAGSLSCRVFVNAEEGVGQSAGSKLAITVACGAGCCDRCWCFTSIKSRGV